MFNFNMEIPEVGACDESRCAYNANKSCHARAITIGDGITPMCDTFFVNSKHIHDVSQMAGVGACKINTCNFNNDFECQADHIHVGHQEGAVRCTTYQS